MTSEPGEFTPSFIADLALASAALAFARELHSGQRRASDEAPFILHPLEVAALLFNHGQSEPVVAAGILHDTVESSAVELGEIRERFGDQVACLVAAVTEDAGIQDAAERKASLRRQVAQTGPEASAIYAADKVAKVREFRARLTADPHMLGREPSEQLKLDHYRESLVMLEELTPDYELVRQLRFELEALRSLPPHDHGLSPVLGGDRL